MEENLGDEVVAVAFRKDDKEYSEKINKALDEMKKDGTMKTVSYTHLTLPTKRIV